MPSLVLGFLRWPAASILSLAGERPESPVSPDGMARIPSEFRVMGDLRVDLADSEECRNRKQVGTCVAELAKDG